MMAVSEGMNVAAPAKSATRAPVFAPADFGSGAVDGAKHRILIVEDDFLVAGELEYALQNAGFEVAGTAGSASEAIELAKTQQPTLAIMDIRLAGTRDGVDTAIELFQNYGIRSIFATAHQDPTTVGRATKAEPIGWLQKPYTMAALIKTIKAALL